MAMAVTACRALDMWGLGCLVWELWHGALARPEQLKTVAQLPKALVPQYVQLVRCGVSVCGRLDGMTPAVPTRRAAPPPQRSLPKPAAQARA